MNERLQRAKAAWTRAAEAMLAGHPQAQRMCEEALHELQQARKQAQRPNMRQVEKPFLPN